MMRHTLQTLGPKVLASRMVRDYVHQLYSPAALASRAIVANDFAEARSLAAYASRVRDGWPGVQVEHVEAGGIDDAPERGTDLTVRAFISLGSLAPADVDVQLASGRVDHNDRIVDASISVLVPTEQLDAHRWRYETTVALDRTGAFGYTVRVLPRHESLANSLELGLQALPPTAEDLPVAELGVPAHLA